MPLHERSDEELKDKLSSGELSQKKTAVAEAVLKRRRTERIKAWLKRHVWFGCFGRRTRIDCVVIADHPQQRMIVDAWL